MGRQLPAKPANDVTIGFGVELSEVASENPQRAPSACEPQCTGCWAITLSRANDRTKLVS
jgi:hypothetical protein